jgi:hypothetical protein
MNPNEFVSMLHSEIIEQNADLYRSLFENTAVEAASDEYWKKALGLFNALSLDQKEIFFRVIRQTAVDALSNVLAVIDGSIVPDGVSEDFCLTLGESKVPLNGDLQDVFLAMEESASR